jgi:hypothetical protein
MAKRICPICEGTAEIKLTAEGHEVKCQICSGSELFLIARSLLSVFEQENFASSDDYNLVRYLSAYIRQHSSPEKKIVSLRTDNWKDCAQMIRSTPVVRKMDKLLRMIADDSAHPGDLVTIHGTVAYPLVDAANPKEFEYLLRHLEKTGLISIFREVAATTFGITLRPEGWARLQTITPSKGIPGRCFVAMSFSETLNEAYSLAIEPALKSCGLDPRRVDKILDNRDINEKIIAELRDAEMVVADFTLQRNGVYFEAGFARGLGREVFWTCRDDDMKELHFDTRQFSFIVWKNALDLKQQLTDKIKALGFARN